MWASRTGSSQTVDQIPVTEVYDELAGSPGATVSPVAPFRAAEGRERRVQPNAATAHTARLDAARDADAIDGLFADE
jgi:hypothetical protein